MQLCPCHLNRSLPLPLAVILFWNCTMMLGEAINTAARWMRVLWSEMKTVPFKASDGSGLFDPGQASAGIKGGKDTGVTPSRASPLREGGLTSRFGFCRWIRGRQEQARSLTTFNISSGQIKIAERAHGTFWEAVSLGRGQGFRARASPWHAEGPQLNPCIFC